MWAGGIPKGIGGGAVRLDVQSGRWDSNPRRSAWKADALPTELLPRRDGAMRRPRRWRVLDSNQRRRMPAGLQPAPFGHSGNPPWANPSTARAGQLGAEAPRADTNVALSWRGDSNP